MREITSYPLPPRFRPARLGETYRIFLDAGKARRELGWQPTVRLADGLEQTVAYFQAMEEPV